MPETKQNTIKPTEASEAAENAEVNVSISSVGPLATHGPPGASIKPSESVEKEAPEMGNATSRSSVEPPESKADCHKATVASSGDQTLQPDKNVSPGEPKGAPMKQLARTTPVHLSTSREDPPSNLHQSMSDESFMKPPSVAASAKVSHEPEVKVVVAQAPPEVKQPSDVNLQNGKAAATDLTTTSSAPVAASALPAQATSGPPGHPSTTAQLDNPVDDTVSESMKARQPLTDLYGPYIVDSDTCLEDARNRLRTALEQTRQLRVAFTKRVYEKYRVCLVPPPTIEEALAVRDHDQLLQEIASIKEEKDVEKKEAAKLNAELSAVGNSSNIVESADQLSYYSAGLNLIILPEDNNIDRNLLKDYDVRGPITETGQRVRGISQAAATAGDIMLDRARKSVAMRVERQRRKQLQLLSGESEVPYSRLEVLTTTTNTATAASTIPAVRPTLPLIAAPVPASGPKKRSKSGDIRPTLTMPGSQKGSRSRNQAGSLSTSMLMSVAPVADEIIGTKASASTCALTTRSCIVKSTQQRLKHPHPESYGGRRRANMNPAKKEQATTSSSEPFLQAYLALTLPPLPAAKERLERKQLPICDGATDRAKTAVQCVMQQFVDGRTGETLRPSTKIGLLYGIRKMGAAERIDSKTPAAASANVASGHDTTFPSTPLVAGTEPSPDSAVDPVVAFSVLTAIGLISNEEDDRGLDMPEIDFESIASDKLKSLRKQIMEPWPMVTERLFSTAMPSAKRNIGSSQTDDDRPSKKVREEGVPAVSIRGGGEALLESTGSANADSPDRENSNKKTVTEKTSKPAVVTSCTTEECDQIPRGKRKYSDTAAPTPACESKRKYSDPGFSPAHGLERVSPQLEIGGISHPRQTVTDPAKQSPNEIVPGPLADRAIAMADYLTTIIRGKSSSDATEQGAGNASSGDKDTKFCMPDDKKDSKGTAKRKAPNAPSFGETGETGCVEELSESGNDKIRKFSSASDSHGLRLFEPSPPEALSSSDAAAIKAGKFHQVVYDKSSQSEKAAALEYLAAVGGAVPIPKALVSIPLREKLNTPGFKSAGSGSIPVVPRDLVVATIVVWLWANHENSFQEAFEKSGRIDVDPDCKWLVNAAVDSSVRTLALDIAESIASGEGPFAEASAARKTHLSTKSVNGNQSTDSELAELTKKVEVHAARLVSKALVSELSISKTMNEVVPRFPKLIEYLDEARLCALKAKTQERAMLANVIARKATMSEPFALAYASAMIRAGEALGHENLFELVQDSSTSTSSMIPYDIFTFADSEMWEDPCKPDDGFVSGLSGDVLMRRAHARAMIHKAVRKIQERNHIRGGVSGQGPYVDRVEKHRGGTPTGAQAVASGSISPRQTLKRRTSSFGEPLAPPGTGSAHAKSWAVYEPSHVSPPLDWHADHSENLPYGLHRLGDNVRALSLSMTSRKSVGKRIKRSGSFGGMPPPVSEKVDLGDEGDIPRSTHEINWADIAGIFQSVELPKKSPPSKSGNSSEKDPPASSPSSKNIIAPFCHKVNLDSLEDSGIDSDSEEDLSDQTVLRRHQVVLDQMKEKLDAFLQARKRQQDRRKSKGQNKSQIAS